MMDMANTNAPVMESTGVLMLCLTSTYLEDLISSRFNLIRPWYDREWQFLQLHSHSIRAVVGNAVLNADSAIIDSLPNLEIVATFGEKVDRIDLIKCKERGIRVTNTPDVLTADVADLAIGLAISTTRMLSKGDLLVRSEKGDFRQVASKPKFSGKSVGIVGLGRIGSAIAKRAKAFGCHISYHSTSQKAETGYKFYANVVDLARDSDILFVACSLTKYSHHIINREALDALGPNGVLINIAWGALVDQAELVSALLEGRLGGAGLDLFEDEPDTPEELHKLHNVVLASPKRSHSVQYWQAMADLVFANLEAHFSNKPLPNPVL